MTEYLPYFIVKFRIKCLPASWLSIAISDTDLTLWFCLPNVKLTLFFHVFFLYMYSMTGTVNAITPCLIGYLEHKSKRNDISCRTFYYSQYHLHKMGQTRLRDFSTCCFSLSQPRLKIRKCCVPCI